MQKKRHESAIVGLREEMATRSRFKVIRSHSNEPPKWGRLVELPRRGPGSPGLLSKKHVPRMQRSCRLRLLEEFKEGTRLSSRDGTLTPVKRYVPRDETN